MKKFIFSKSYVLLLTSLCLTSAVSAADVILAEAYSGTTGLNNLTNKPAALVENLLLPKAWGDETTPKLTVVGKVVELAQGSTNYLWDTSLYPDVYLVQLEYGSTTNTALFTVNALAQNEWGTLDLDNLAVRTAKNSETLTLPKAWGEDVTGLQLVYTDDLGGEQVIDLSEYASATQYGWSTLPLLPGSWKAKLIWNGGSAGEAVDYVVEAAGEGDMVGATFVDNKYDNDVAGNDVRNIANHTNEFVMTWQDATKATLTLDGDEVAKVEESGWNWLWETNGLTYALYSFTNTVDGSNYVARFRVNVPNVAVVFHKDTNDVLVAKDWYQQNVQALGVADSRKVISDALKQTGPNGYALWKSYVLNIATNETVDLVSNIAVTNLEQSVVQVTVWPTNFEQRVIREGTQAAVDCGIDYTESLETQKWIRAKNLISSGDVKYTETLTNKVHRFYRTNLDVVPTPKE